jgi:hypothetical protein
MGSDGTQIGGYPSGGRRKFNLRVQASGLDIIEGANHLKDWPGAERLLRCTRD